MTKIYRDHKDRLLVADAMRLVQAAMPATHCIDVFVMPDGSLKVEENLEGCPAAPFMAGDFLDICNQLGITPRMMHRPAVAGYTGNSSTDDLIYSITHDEFVQYAEMYGMEVAIGKPPELAAPPATAGQVEPIQTAPVKLDFSMWATRDMLIEAFGPHTGLNMTWFDKLQGPLLRARVFKGEGKRGHTVEPWFCPYEVMKWLTSKNFRKKSSMQMPVRMGWRMLKQHFRSVYDAHHLESPFED